MSTTLPVFELLGERGTCCNRCGRVYGCDVAACIRRAEDDGRPIAWLCDDCGHIFVPVAGTVGRDMTAAEKAWIQKYDRSADGVGRAKQEKAVERMIG